MNKVKQTRKKKVVSRIITFLCLGVFFYAAYGLVDTALEYYKNRQVLNETQDMFYNAVSAEEGETVTTERGTFRPEFKELLEGNPDVAGWITIGGTQIDYPILQANNNEKYLYRNFYKDDSIAGSIFLDYRNDMRTPESNTIIYGHRMKDGSMFQHLTKFTDQDFFEKHRKIELETLHDSFEAEIFAVYNTTTDFDYIQTDFSSTTEFGDLLEKIKAKSMFDADIEVNEKDQILTLSTCDYTLDPDEGRLVVHAKLVEKGSS